jgi:hypothetical protein
MATLTLNDATWDLELNASGNIAVTSDPDSLAQDAASAIKTLLGECYWDTTVGVPYLTQILAPPPPQAPPSLALLKQQFINAALTVPGVAAAQCFITSFSNREVSGQVQVVPSSGGTTQAANFSVSNPQGGG